MVSLQELMALDKSKLPTLKDLNANKEIQAKISPSLPPVNIIKGQAIPTIKSILNSKNVTDIPTSEEIMIPPMTAKLPPIDIIKQNAELEKQAMTAKPKIPLMKLEAANTAPIQPRSFITNKQIDLANIQDILPVNKPETIVGPVAGEHVEGQPSKGFLGIDWNELGTQAASFLQSPQAYRLASMLESNPRTQQYLMGKANEIAAQQSQAAQQQIERDIDTQKTILQYAPESYQSWYSSLSPERHNAIGKLPEGISFAKPENIKPEALVDPETNKPFMGYFDANKNAYINVETKQPIAGAMPYSEQKPETRKYNEYIDPTTSKKFRGYDTEKGVVNINTGKIISGAIQPEEQPSLQSVIVKHPTLGIPVYADRNPKTGKFILEGRQYDSLQPWKEPKTEKAEKDNTAKEETGLRKELNQLLEVKTFKDMRQFYNKIKSTPESPGGDMALVFNFMKMLDPTSVVRESEYASAAKARGVPDSIANLMQNVATGKTMTPTQRKDFRNVAQIYYNNQARLYNNSVSDYRGYAAQEGLDPDNVAKIVPISEIKQTKSSQQIGQSKSKSKISGIEGLLNMNKQIIGEKQKQAEIKQLRQQLAAIQQKNKGGK